MSINTPLGSNAWFAEQEKAKAAEQAAEAQRQAEAAKSQPAPVPQSAKDRAFLEAEKVYRQIMDQEAAKTAAQRDADALSVEVSQLSARLDQMNANPTAYPERDQVLADFNTKLARLSQLTAQPEQARQEIYVSSRGIIGLEE